MVEYIVGGAVLKAVSDGQFAAMCIKNMSQSIYGLLGYIVKNPDNILIETLTTLDIEFKVRILESLINDINTDIKHSTTLGLCLYALKECIILIEKELNKIHAKINYNNSIILFKSWRSHTFEENIMYLKSHSYALETRRKLLFDILSINSELINNKSIMIRDSLILKNKY